MLPRWQRTSHARIVEHGTTLTVVASDGTAYQLSETSATLAREVLDFFRSPHTRQALLTHLATLSGGPIENPEVIDQLLQLLVQAEALRESTQTPSAKTPSAQPPPPGKRLLLGVSGAIAAMYTPALVTLLQQEGHEVRVCATPNALRFFRAESVEALTHAPVMSDIWQGEPTQPAPHIALARWAEGMLLYPTSATTLSRLVHGDFSSLLAAIALTTRAPVLLAPSMNAAMLDIPAVQRNLQQAREDGFFVLDPTMGQEVADHPTDRPPTWGAALPHREIRTILRAILAQHTPQQASAGESPETTPSQASPHAPPHGKEAWEACYTSHPHDQLPWKTDTLDTDLATLLKTHASSGKRLLEIGTGLGTLAIEAAQWDFHIVATDISRAALQTARERAPDARVTWLQDDITESHLIGPFDLLVDRGCLHTLPPTQHAAYLENLTRLTNPGALLLLKTHHHDAPQQLHTHRFDRQELQDLFAPAFTLLESHESTFPGPLPQHPKALLSVFRRR